MDCSSKEESIAAVAHSFRVQFRETAEQSVTSRVCLVHAETFWEQKHCAVTSDETNRVLSFPLACVLYPFLLRVSRQAGRPRPVCHATPRHAPPRPATPRHGPPRPAGLVCGGRRPVWETDVIQSVIRARVDSIS